jgi:hypothetical protein
MFSERYQRFLVKLFSCYPMCWEQIELSGQVYEPGGGKLEHPGHLDRTQK